VIDMRGGGGRGGAVLPIGGGVGGLGLVVYLLIALIGGGGSAGLDIPGAFGPATRAPQGTPIPADQDPERDLRDFSAYVFTDAQQRWSRTVEADGGSYRRAKLVLYRSAVSTGCGNASSAVGPFYCPADERVYLDLSFFDDMRRELGAGGDFAWAYVIAHEMGHHVQNVLGTSDEVDSQRRSDPSAANELSVRLELQADCYAGVWAHGVYAAGQLEAGDLDEAFNAAEAVGDDRLQRRARGSVDPDSFTHGTSAQRREWFTRGQRAGEPAACDTFGE
jgi:predicted metalloprotease